MTQTESQTIAAAQEVRVARRIDALHMTTLPPEEAMRIAMSELAKLHTAPLREAIEKLLYHTK